MINFIVNRLLKRAGLTPEALRDLVEQGTKELDELPDLQRDFEQNGETLKQAFVEWEAEAKATLHKAKEDAAQRRAAQDAEAKRAIQLDEMLQRLRPGMHIRDLDHIAARFGDAYTAEALRNHENWTGVVKGKCVIDYDSDGLLTRVKFSGATKDTRHIAAAKRMENVLQTCAGVTHAEDLEVHDRSLLKAVELGTNTPNVTILAWFWSGRFHSTTYLTDAERDRMAKAIAAQRPPKPAKPEPFSAKTPDQIAADTALRKTYYAWADESGDETHREFVEWIINETSPDARHYLIGSNWDKGFDIPLWIIRQPGTYLATAFKVFEGGAASYWLARPKTKNPDSEFAYELIDRIRNGFYATPTGDKAISYTPPFQLDDYPPDDGEAPEKTSVFEPVKGRADNQVYCDVPEKFIDYLN
ncbi:MAG: DUF4274 domain-containing protein [Sedimentitalea sp.]